MNAAGCKGRQQDAIECSRMQRNAAAGSRMLMNELDAFECSRVQQSAGGSKI